MVRKNRQKKIKMYPFELSPPVLISRFWCTILGWLLAALLLETLAEIVESDEDWICLVLQAVATIGMLLEGANVVETRLEEALWSFGDTLLIFFKAGWTVLKQE